MVTPPLPARLRGAALGAADAMVTWPLMRWTWRGLGDDAFAAEIPEIRPADGETVRDMMAGRYLLASRLVETGGASPFSLDSTNPDWWQNLHGFSWLRHFRDVRDPASRRFAGTLVLDWISREGQFERDSWAVGLTAQRVLNWLRHLALLLEGATAEQTRTIQRVLGTQVQSLKFRAPLARDPADALLAAVALTGAAYCDQSESADLASRVERLNATLSSQLDSSGLHLSRNPRLHLQLLVELASIRPLAASVKSEAANELGAQIDRMHESLDALTLSTGEPVYFNGTGQLPHDVLVAVQAHGPSPRHKSQLLGGYGILRDGDTVVIADSGLRPPYGFDRDAHAGSLAFELSHGSELIIGSCGPAPADLPESRDLFRQGVAHSAPTIDAEDIPGNSVMTLDPADHALTMTSKGYARSTGFEIERRISLLSEGTTVVGQDRLIGDKGGTGLLSVRFHLGPGTMVRRGRGEGIVRLVLPNGQTWSFLWEGAGLREEESVRQSAYLGFHRTTQLVLEAPVARGAEIAWIVTLEQ